MGIQPGYADAGRKEQEERTDTLSAAVQDMGRDRIDEGHTGIKIFSNPTFDPVQFVSIRLPDVCHTMDGRGDRSVRHAADGRAAG